MPTTSMNTYVILHNIRSAHNVGSVFRTADGAGVSKMYLTGYTPAPLDRFGRINKEIEKTSLGASASVPFECSDVEPLVKGLKSKGVKIVAVEQTEKATDYRMFMPSGDVAYIFGNEITGIEPEVLTHAHEHIQIPLAGMKESLNVSVCAGIILFSRR